MTKEERQIQKALGLLPVYYIKFKGPNCGMLYECLIENTSSEKDAIKEAYNNPPFYANFPHPPFLAMCQRLQKSHKISIFQNRLNGCNVQICRIIDNTDDVEYTAAFIAHTEHTEWMYFDLRDILTITGKLRKNAHRHVQKTIFKYLKRNAL